MTIRYRATPSHVLLPPARGLPTQAELQCAMSLYFARHIAARMIRRMRTQAGTQ